MAGGSQQQKPSAGKPSASSAAANRKSRWESGNTNNSNQNPKSNPSNPPHDPSKKPGADQIKPTSSSAKPAPSPKPAADLIPYPDPPQPSYGFHMLERRTIVLFDGSVRSYFALPPDYQDFSAPPRFSRPAEFGGGVGRFPPGVPMSPDGFGRGGRPQDYWNSLGLDGGVGAAEGSLKRKYGEGDERRGEFLRQKNNPNWSGNDFSGGTSRQDEMRGGKYMRVEGGNYDGVKQKHVEVDPKALKKAFLHFVKVVSENPAQRKKYLENGKQGPVKCVVCGRSSKDFVDMHALIMHTYSPDNADYVDHLGLHKALCVLMGWNYSKPPDNSKAYQLLSADEAAANKDDLIIWPPTVIIHNTITGKNRDGRMEGLGNKAMDSIIRDLGCVSGKSKSLYGREGHLGITLIKFASDQSGLVEAVRLAEYFEKENHGRNNWARIQPLVLGKDDEKNPNLVKTDERTGERMRIFYGYLLTASDLDKLDFDTRKKVTIESRREYKSSN